MKTSRENNLYSAIFIVLINYIICIIISYLLHVSLSLKIIIDNIEKYTLHITKMTINTYMQKILPTNVIILRRIFETYLCCITFANLGDVV